MHARLKSIDGFDATSRSWVWHVLTINVMARIVTTELICLTDGVRLQQLIFSFSDYR